MVSRSDVGLSGSEGRGSGSEGRGSGQWKEEFRRT
jgi:hypothetical protein